MRDTTPGAWHAPIGRPFRRRGTFTALVLLVGFLTAAASTWPLVLHLTDHIVDGARFINAEHPERWAPANIGADVFTTVWILNWDLHALRTQPLDLFDANIFWPARLALARSEHMLATALLGVPGRLVGGPVFAHQTALLLSLTLSAWATAWVTWRWTGSRLAALATGILFVTIPFHQAQRMHLQSLGTAGFPLIVLGLERFGAEGRRRWLALATGALVWQMASGQYLAFFALTIWGVAGAIALLAGRPADAPWRRFGRDLCWLALASAAAAGAYLPLALPYAHLSRLAELPSNVDQPLLQLGIFSVAEYVTGAATHALWQVRIAPPLLALAAVGIVAWRRTEWRRVVLLVVVAVVGALLSLGPKPGGLGLYRLLADVMPGFHTLREPVRFVIVPQLAAVLLAGGGIASLARRWARVGALLACALVAWAVVQNVHGTLPLRAVGVPEPYRYLARCGAGDPLLELPAWHVGLEWRDAERSFLSTYHWLPLLNGRSGYSPPIKELNMALARQLPSPDALAELRATTSVRWILVDCEARRETAPFCRAPEVLRIKYRRFARYVLYDLGPAPVLPRPTPRWATPPDCDQGFRG